MKVALAAALLALPVLTLPIDGGVISANPTCRGEVAVLATGDAWGGGAGRDVVVAKASMVNAVYTHGGDDLVCVYNDTNDVTLGVYVDTGAGNDTVQTYNGNNHIVAGNDNDIIYLNGYVEYVEGGSGNDHVWGSGSGQVIAYGGAGTDLLQGSPGGDSLSGEADGDLIIGGSGNDGLDGGSGNDTIQGNAGSDTLLGNTGTDSCSDAATSTFIECETVVHTGPGGITT